MEYMLSSLEEILSLKRIHRPETIYITQIEECNQYQKYDQASKWAFFKGSQAIMF